MQSYKQLVDQLIAAKEVDSFRPQQTNYQLLVVPAPKLEPN